MDSQSSQATHALSLSEKEETVDKTSFKSNEEVFRKIIYEAYTIVYHKFIKDYKKIPLDEALKKIKIDDEKAKYFVKKAKSFKINEEGTFEAFLQILEEIDFYKNPPFSFIKPIFPQPIEEIDDD
jgi:hypothetical protein